MDNNNPSVVAFRNLSATQVRELAYQIAKG